MHRGAVRQALAGRPAPILPAGVQGIVVDHQRVGGAGAAEAQRAEQPQQEEQALERTMAHGCHRHFITPCPGEVSHSAPLAATLANRANGNASPWFCAVQPDTPSALVTTPWLVVA